MIRTRYADMVAAVMMFVIAVGFWVVTESFPTEAAKVPRLTLGAIIALSVVQLVKACMDKTEKTLSFDYSRISRIILSSLVYAVMISIIGYYAATFLYVFAVMFLFGIRKKVLLVVVPIGFIVLAHVVFINILSIRVPLPFFM